VADVQNIKASVRERDLLPRLAPLFHPALELIDSLRRDGLALLMVEHVISAITAISDEVLVLHHGQVLTTGSPAAVLADERVIEAYLGSRYAARAAQRRETS